MPKSIHDLHISQHRGNAQIHANNRAAERLGIVFNRKIARELIDKIKESKYGAGVQSIAIRCRVWYYIPDLKAWVLYDRKLKRIVTLLDIVPKDVEIQKEKENGERREQVNN